MAGASVGDGPPGMFTALRVRNFRLYMSGQSISVAGNWMQNVAVGWLVLTLSGSGAVLGAVTAARYLPILLLGQWGGLIADRRDKRVLLRITASTQAVVSTAIGVLTLTHVINIWSLIVLILVAGTVDVFDTPARQAFVNNLVGRDRLANAIALNSIVTNVSRIVGPGVAGFLIAGLGVGPCFIANAISFGAVVLGLQLMRTADLVPSRIEVRGAGQIRAGLHYVAHAPQLVTALLLVVVAGTFAWEFQVTLPLLTSTTFHGGSRGYGGALASLAAGSIVGGVVATRRRGVTRRTLALSAIVWGVVIIAASLAPTLPVTYALLAVVGGCAVTFSSASKTLLQIESAENMRGRVMSLWSIGWQGTTVVGAPVVGWVGEQFGARSALALGGATTLAAGLGVLTMLVIRRGAGSTATASID